jgi:hypothetical protein
MTFSLESIVFAIFTGIIAELASYFGSYSKVKAEVRAATEDLRQTIENLTRLRLRPTSDTFALAAAGAAV